MSAVAAHHRLRVDGLQLGGLQLQAALEFRAPWTVVFGPSGSGKSSLLRAMCGLLAGAQVEFARQPQGRWQRLDALAPERRGLAYAPQGALLFPHLTVWENVAFAARCRGLGRRQVAESVTEALALLGLEAMAERRPAGLSGGERQRVALARALAVPSPSLLLLDEPFTGLDRELRETLLERMRVAMVQRGVPVISVTHDVEEALRLQAEVVRLAEGRVLAQGTATEVLASERAAMLRVLG